MAKYKVTFLYTTYISVNVDADNEDSARDAAENKIDEMSDSWFDSNISKNRTFDGVEIVNIE